MSARARLAGLQLLWLGLVAWTLLTSAAAQAEFRVPALTGPVVDDAGLISASSRGRLEEALRALQKQGGTQLAVLTVPSLGGLTIEQASIQIVDKWKLGGEREDNGVLLLIAQQERRVRIEVGQGLEGALTDAHSKRIVDEAITPLFRAGDYDAGITVGVYQIARRTNPDIDLRPQLEGALRSAPARDPRGRGNGGLSVLAMLLFISIAIARSGLGGGYSRRGRYLWGGGIAGAGLGGAFRGGGFGGGGFSGGGGGFSGGGASGGW